jgi:hypothetical protein
MTLSVAIRQHAPERCPAGEPAMRRMLLNHLSAANAAKHGVSIQAEAVANVKHTLYLIAEAGDEEQLSQFLGPFVQAGSVELLPASSYEMVINRGGLLQRPPDAAAGQPRLVPNPAGVPAQHRVLLPEHEQFSIFHPVAAEHQDGHAEDPGRQQIDDLEQHPASQPSRRPFMPATMQVTHPIEYSRGVSYRLCK